MPADTLSLAGKTALVTGSGRENGIGAAIAKALARNGANVAIHYVSESSKSRAEAVASNISKEFGVKTTAVRGALENANTPKVMVEQILKDFSVDHIDILVNNAGTSSHVPLMQAKEENIQQDFSVNVFGLIYMTQAVVSVGKMPQGGRIVNIGSIASKILIPPPVYSAAKAAADALTTLFAAELGKSHGITVNTLAPGPVPTDMSRDVLMNADGSPTPLSQALFQQTRAAARLGAVEDLADAVLLIVSEKSRWITGEFISVSGGITGTM